MVACVMVGGTTVTPTLSADARIIEEPVRDKILEGLSKPTP